MVSRKEHAERMPRKWFSFLARRQHVSSGIVEASCDVVVEESPQVEKETQYELTGKMVPKSAFESPFWRLQSSQMSVNQWADAPKQDEAMRLADPPDTEMGVSQPSAALKRLVQHLPSVSSFGASKRAEAFPAQPPPSTEVAPGMARKVRKSLLPETGVDQDEQHNNRHEFGSLAAMKGTPEASYFTLNKPATTVPCPGPQRQRLAGRIAKIRLQTASDTVCRVVPLSQISVTPSQDALSSSAMPFRGKAERSVNGGIPPSGLGKTLPRLPIPKKKQKEASVPQQPVAGSGIVESGQLDVTVVNHHVTAASVVLVTLIENAGPVVVQYVSLQPQKGFTVHLTAPATRKAMFNYLVLHGEPI